LQGLTLSMPPTQAGSSSPHVLNFQISGQGSQAVCVRPSKSSRGAAAKPAVTIDPTTFADLRQQWPPEDPTMLHQKYLARKSTPKSPPGTEIFSYAPPECNSDRAKRWQLWRTLSEIGFFVAELYNGTSYQGYVNSWAGPGSKGQEVVHTGHGTILYMTSTHRLYSPNPRGDMLLRLGIVFAPWQPTIHGWQAYEGRFPATATSLSPAPAVAHINAAPLDFGVSRQ